MFYKFDNIIGRIARSTQIEAYTPQGLSPLKRGPPVIIFDSMTTKIAHEPEVTPRPVAASGTIPEASSAASLAEAYGVVPATPRYRRIMEIQNQFLKDDGKLVWQKLGRDRGSYYFTLGLVVVGTVLSFNILFQMSFPKKSEE
ncbi:hypothetical protein ACOMHN_002878 [Nucella lapillus]